MIILFNYFINLLENGYSENGEKSLKSLAHICDVNSIVAEELNRPDLKATWQVIKMLYTDYRGLIHSSNNSRSITKCHKLSESFKWSSTSSSNWKEINEY